MNAFFISFAARAYGAIVSVWQATYRWVPGRIRRVPARVISIGNITWGGTGKTPLTIRLALDLKEAGKSVAVLTRGYAEDEVRELRASLPEIPVLVGRDRVRTAREAVKKGAQFLILEDGFQHIRLHRDLDIVNINSTQPFGPGGLIPAGTLREPIGNLRRADVFMLTKANIGSKNVAWIRQKLESIKPGATVFEAVHRPLRFRDPLRNRHSELSHLRGRKVATIAAIADPLSFEKTVESIGAEIVFAGRFDDHHDFTRKELADFVEQCRQIGACDVVTTEKDFMRIEPLLAARSDALDGVNLYVLEIEFEIQDEEAFLRRCLDTDGR